MKIQYWMSYEEIILKSTENTKFKRKFICIISIENSLAHILKCIMNSLYEKLAEKSVYNNEKIHFDFFRSVKISKFIKLTN